MPIFSFLKVPLFYTGITKASEIRICPCRIFFPSLLKAAHQTIVNSLTLPDSLNVNLYMDIKTIIRDYHENKINNLLARRFFFIRLAMTKDGAERNVILAIEALFPALKDLDIGHLRELGLAAPFIHPLIQALLSYENVDKIARCANALPDNGTDVNQRPDYEVMVYGRYQPPTEHILGNSKVKDHPIHYQ